MYVVNLLNQYLLVRSGTVFCFWHTKIPVSLQLLVPLSELEEHGNLITGFVCAAWTFSIRSGQGW